MITSYTMVILALQGFVTDVSVKGCLQNGFRTFE